MLCLPTPFTNHVVYSFAVLCSPCPLPSVPSPRNSNLTFRMAATSLVYGSEGTSVDAVVLEDGRQFHANAIVSATGAWMRELMPVPMVPHKGQMMSLREPEGGRRAGAPKQGGGIGLTRVFFAEGCYIIPKRDGRIVVGSTVEVGKRFRSSRLSSCGFVPADSPPIQV